MQKLILTACLLFAITSFKPSNSFAQTTSKYRCMVQMTNYMGEGAYIIVSLIDAKNQYVKTLYVLGSNKKWYNSLKEWHKFQVKNKENISAITGASLTGGDRTVANIAIESAKINAGFKLRFESAVEDKNYFVKDVEIPLTTEALSAKTDGTGFIRYVRFSSN
ncbi:hypothetical protein ACVWYG_003126 [Pedobacter sp. UYEF25]